MGLLIFRPGDHQHRRAVGKDQKPHLFGVGARKLTGRQGWRQASATAPIRSIISSGVLRRMATRLAGRFTAPSRMEPCREPPDPAQINSRWLTRPGPSNTNAVRSGEKNSALAVVDNSGRNVNPLRAINRFQFALQVYVTIADECSGWSRWAGRLFAVIERD